MDSNAILCNSSFLPSDFESLAHLTLACRKITEPLFHEVTLAGISRAVTF